MTYQEAKIVRMRRTMCRQAIMLAMDGKWTEAVDLNKAYLQKFPQDVDAYNRLGKAYMELGEYPQAKESYEHAASLDPYNIIAKNNLGRLARIVESEPTVTIQHRKAQPQHFIEEIGKARVLQLHNVAPTSVLVKAMAGDEIYLKRDGASLLMENEQGEYLGQVAARFARRLIELMEGGNQYSAAVVSSTPNNITVIIRETFQDPSQVGRLSFTSRRLEGLQVHAGDRSFRVEDMSQEETDEFNIDTSGESNDNADNGDDDDEGYEN